MDAVTEAEKVLVNGLAPFVENALKARWGENWIQEVNLRRVGPRDRKLVVPIRWDVPELLRTIDDFWEPIRVSFLALQNNENINPTEIRASVALLRQLRNRARHVPRTPFTDRDRDRFVDLAEHLLRLAGKNEHANTIAILLAERLIIQDNDILKPQDETGTTEALRKDVANENLNETTSPPGPDADYKITSSRHAGILVWGLSRDEDSEDDNEYYHVALSKEEGVWCFPLITRHETDGDHEWSAKVDAFARELVPTDGVPNSVLPIKTRFVHSKIFWSKNHLYCIEYHIAQSDLVRPDTAFQTEHAYMLWMRALDIPLGEFCYRDSEGLVACLMAMR